MCRGIPLEYSFYKTNKKYPITVYLKFGHNCQACRVCRYDKKKYRSFTIKAQRNVGNKHFAIPFNHPQQKKYNQENFDLI